MEMDFTLLQFESIKWNVSMFNIFFSSLDQRLVIWKRGPSQGWRKENRQELGTVVPVFPSKSHTVLL